MDAHFPEGFDGGRAGRTHGVRYSDDADDSGVRRTGCIIRGFRTGEQQRGLALAGETVHFRFDLAYSGIWEIVRISSI